MTILRVLLCSFLFLTLGGIVPAARQTDDDETPRRAIGEHFEAQMLWFNQHEPDGPARAVLGIAEAVAAVELDGLPKMVKEETLPCIGLAPTPKFLRERAGIEARQLLVATVPDVEFGGHGPESLRTVAISPGLDDRTLFFVGLPPASAHAVASVAAEIRLEQAVQSKASLAADPLRLECLRARLIHDGLVAARRGFDLGVDPSFNTALRGLMDALEVSPKSANDGDSTVVDVREIRLEQLVIAYGKARTGSEVVSLERQQAFSPSVGEAACLLLHRASFDTARALSDLEQSRQAVQPTGELRSGQSNLHLVTENGSIGVAADAFVAVAPRRSDALCLTPSPIEVDGPLSVSAQIFALANDGRGSTQADIVFGDDGSGDRYLIALSSREGLYMFRRRGEGVAYEPLAELKEYKFPVAQWVSVRLELDGGDVQFFVEDQLALAFREQGRSLKGRVGIGAHAGATALFRGLSLQAGAHQEPETPSEKQEPAPVGPDKDLE